MWHSRTAPPHNTIAVHLEGLRAKLGDDDINPAAILMLRGLGYRFTVPSRCPFTFRSPGAHAPYTDRVEHGQVPPIDNDQSDVQDDCVSVTVAEPLSREEAETLATALKAVADPTRLQLLSMISGSPAGEACVCDLTEPLGLSQPTISHHLKILVDAGLLTRDKRGKWSWYAIVPARLDTLHGLLP